VRRSAALGETQGEGTIANRLDLHKSGSRRARHVSEGCFHPSLTRRALLGAGQRSGELNNQAFQQGARRQLAGTLQTEIGLKQPVEQVLRAPPAEVPQLLLCRLDAKRKYSRLLQSSWQRRPLLV